MKNYKKILALFLFATVIYFSIGVSFTYNLGLHNYWNVLFDLDTPRVFQDLTMFSANHYRVAVHPLFVILFQPPCKILGYILFNKELACLLIQSVFASISLISVKQILEKFKLNKRTVTFLTILFGFSLGQIVFSSNIETYVFAQGLLALMWLFAAIKMDKEFKLWDYIILTLLGVGSLAVTLTNVFQFIIVLFFVITLNKKIKNRYVMTLVVGISALSLSVFLGCIQNLIWESAPNFFTKNISDFINKTSEENLYIEKGLSFKKILNVLNALFGYSFNMVDVYLPKTGVYLTFKSSIVTNVFSIISAIAFVILNVWYVIKTKLNIVKYKLYYGLAGALLFNMLLHLFYGNSISFLYVCHFNFLLIILLGYLLKELKITLLDNKIINYILSGIVIILSVRIIIKMYITLLPRFTPVESFSIVPFIIIAILCIVAFLLVFSKKRYIVTSIIILLTAMSGLYLYLNRPTEVKECDTICQYEKEFNEYDKQLKDLKNAFMIQTYEDRDEHLDVFFFGMADRKKFVYKEGKLYDVKGNVLRTFEYDYEKIIPNMYTVILKNKNDVYRITENEDGVFLYTNEKEEKLTSGKKINLPEFDGKKYSEILKVVHQEMLFNINGSEPLPNIWGYTQAYYRDAMLVTMVLEDNNNTDLIVDWVNGLTKVYDNSRSPRINEPDNLGEILYIIGATGSNNKSLANKTIKEIESLKDENKHISGMVDGVIQTYYPTSLALFGAAKYGIELDLDYPIVDDCYGKLTWYMDHRVESGGGQSDPYYPYINWAYYHYTGYGKLFILDELYPLSYEGGLDIPDRRQENACFISDFYCSKNLHLSHAWSAAEMYLMLLDY